VLVAACWKRPTGCLDCSPPKFRRTCFCSGSCSRRAQNVASIPSGFGPRLGACSQLPSAQCSGCSYRCSCISKRPCAPLARRTCVTGQGCQAPHACDCIYTAMAHNRECFAAKVVCRSQPWNPLNLIARFGRGDEIACCRSPKAIGRWRVNGCTSSGCCGVVSSWCSSSCNSIVSGERCI